MRRDSGGNKREGRGELILEPGQKRKEEKVHYELIGPESR